uniref:Uncharacterized protein n=1 Tax=Rhinopithecus bieti TaxID=61621 RepID=A0A2K6K9A9_RHIBE
MLPWTALGLALSLRLAAGAERLESGPGRHRVHRQHRPRQLSGAVSRCLSPCQEAPALCGRG